MKTTLILGTCVVLMCMGASVSWTQQPTRPRARALARAKAKPTKARPKARARAKARRRIVTPRKLKKPTSRNTTKPTSRKAPTAEGALKKLLQEGIRQLKAKKYEAFLQRFISPSDKSRILSRMTLKQLAPRFGQHKAPLLLAALSWSLKQKPTFGAHKHKATFSLKKLKTPMPKKILVFVKVKGVWYIKD